MALSAADSALGYFISSLIIGLIMTVMFWDKFYLYPCNSVWNRCVTCCLLFVGYTITWPAGIVYIVISEMWLCYRK